MARRKLSNAQRTAIRKEILKKLRAGMSRTALGRRLSKKYRVSTVTIRWYIKSLKGNATGGGPGLSTDRSRATMRLLDIVKNITASARQLEKRLRKLTAQSVR